MPASSHNNGDILSNNIEIVVEKKYLNRFLCVLFAKIPLKKLP
jgi:hypothetical protein